jgi:HAE1 family hydrophobic/amphiphilic exporter-1
LRRNVAKYDGVKAALKELGETGGILDSQTHALGLSKPLAVEMVFDQTIYIDEALNLVLDNIWQGGLLAVITLVVFLRSWRSIVIVATSVPLAVVATVIVMLGFGRTINVVSLAGFAFAIGTLIDNSIVVLENVVRHMEMGKDARKAAMVGTQEVAGAILGSTLATCVVFIPIFLIGDEVGQLFRDISLAILISNLLSMVVSITFTPCICAFLLKAPAKKKDAAETAAPAAAAAKPGLGDRFATAIARWVFKMSRRRLASLAFVLAMMAASVLGSYFLMPPADYLPKGNRNLVFGLILPPPGTSSAMQEDLAKRVESTVAPYWDHNLPARGTAERAAAEAAHRKSRKPAPMRGPGTSGSGARQQQQQQSAAPPPLLKAGPSEEQKAKIMLAIANASSIEEVKRLEAALKAGDYSAVEALLASQGGGEAGSGSAADGP